MTTAICALSKTTKTDSTAKLPLVSIITATFNAYDDLPRTIKSIREMTYRNIEWIIVDGASTDRTVELIRDSEDVINCWLSEPDSGIYDAWNKGLRLAQGSWIAFLGAGDAYTPNGLDTYIRAIQHTSITPDLVSSRVRLLNAERMPLRVWGGAFEWDEFKKRMTIAHVGALHHCSIFDKYGNFNTNLVSSADYEFLLRCGSQLVTLYLNEITVERTVGGISDGYKGMLETYYIQRMYGACIPATFRFLFACAKRIIRPILRGY